MSNKEGECNVWKNFIIVLGGGGDWDSWNELLDGVDVVKNVGSRGEDVGWG